MFYDFIYLAKGFRMRPKVRSTLNIEVLSTSSNLPESIYIPGSNITEKITI